MRISILVLAVVLTMSSFRSAGAAPHALYNPATGNVQIVVDFDYYSYMAIISPSGCLTNSSDLIDIPGIVNDDTAFPFAYVYLGLKSGTWNTGNTVIPHTPANDLILEYRDNVDFSPNYRGEIIVIPEPAALTLAVVGAAAVFRRRR